MKFLFSCLCVSLFLLTACGDWMKPAPPASLVLGPPAGSNPIGSNPTTENNPTQAPAKLSNFGDVRCHSDQHGMFNEQIKKFLSTSFNPSNARYTVKCAAKSPQTWKGGFFIKGQVSFRDEKFDAQSQNQSLTAEQNSFLELHIADITGRSVIHPIKMNIDTYASVVQGQNASLVFRDQKGKVFLNGSVKPNKHNQLIFTGAFEFENFVNWTGSTEGYKGSIGTFTISACHFFDCSE